MTPWDMWQEASRLRYRVERRRIDALVRESLQKIVNDAATQLDISKGYIAVSGGKDSLVMLDLLWQQHKLAIPAYHMALATRAMPGTRLHLAEMEAYYNQRIQVVFIDEYHAYGGMGDTTGAPIKLSHNDEEYDARFSTYRAFHNHYGLEGSFVGTRAEESKRRFYATKRPILVYKSGSEYGGKWRVNPIARWETKDIWAYIFGHNLPSHPAYRELINHGISPEHARIGEMALSWVSQYGVTQTARELWPDEMNQLREDNPDAYFE